jgi:hypothetical protein
VLNVHLAQGSHFGTGNQITHLGQVLPARPPVCTPDGEMRRIRSFLRFEAERL